MQPTGALGDRGFPLPDVPSTVLLTRGAALRDLVQHTLATSVRGLLDHDRLVRVGEDPEGVHQARVATRRLRSDLRTFAPVLEPEWSTGLRDELRWLGAQLGAVRDTDVLLATLSRRARRLAEPDRAVVAELTRQLDEARTRNRATLLDAMSSPRYFALIDSVVDAVGSPRLSGDRVERRARTVAKPLARRPWRQLRRTIRALPADPTDTQLHEVRKRAKRARYALEAIAPIADSSTRKLASRVRDLQDRLGEHHDAVVAGAWLRERAEAATDHRLSFVSGELAWSFAIDAQRGRDAWPRGWRRAKRCGREVF